MMHEPSPAVDTGETTTATNDSRLFNIDPEMSSLLDDMSHEELRSFADLQEPGSDDEMGLYVYTCSLVFTKTALKEYLERAVLRIEGWVEVTPDDHP
jgi:hypothetical protein